MVIAAVCIGAGIDCVLGGLIALVVIVKILSPLGDMLSEAEENAVKKARLAKAEKIISKFIRWSDSASPEGLKFADIRNEAEIFLKDSE